MTQDIFSFLKAIGKSFRLGSKAVFKVSTVNGGGSSGQWRWQRSMVQGGGQWRKDKEKKVTAMKAAQKNNCSNEGC